MTRKKQTYDYYHILVDESLPSRMQYSVKGYDTWPEGYCLEGQVRITYLGGFASEDAAKAEYPEAEMSHEYIEPVNTFDHLPDTQDD
jgi:hypothetical protein